MGACVETSYGLRHMWQPVHVCEYASWQPLHPALQRWTISNFIIPLFACMSMPPPSRLSMREPVLARSRWLSTWVSQRKSNLVFWYSWYMNDVCWEIRNMRLWLKEIELWFMTEKVSIKQLQIILFHQTLVSTCWNTTQEAAVSVFCSLWWLHFQESYSFQQLTWLHAKPKFANIYLMACWIYRARFNPSEIHNLMQGVDPKTLKASLIRFKVTRKPKIKRNWCLPNFETELCFSQHPFLWEEEKQNLFDWTRKIIDNINLTSLQ